MTHTKNNIPIYATEQIINEETASIQKILNKKEFKQPISTDFEELTNAKKNNWGSTEGMDKLLCERYLFVRENNKPIWLDIPRELMEELELPIGKSCPWPFYVKSKVLEEREEVEGAITIENEEEIFVDKPVSEKNAEKELVKRMENLKELREQVEELQKQGKKICVLFLLAKKKIYELEKELKKEKDWWDKWINTIENWGNRPQEYFLTNINGKEEVCWIDPSYRFCENANMEWALKIATGKNKTNQSVSKDDYLKGVKDWKKSILLLKAFKDDFILKKK